jgi:hypothetical protein
VTKEIVIEMVTYQNVFDKGNRTDRSFYNGHKDILSALDSSAIPSLWDDPVMITCSRKKVNLEANK